MRFRHVVTLLLLACLALPASAGAARPLRIGFLDGLFTTGDAGPWLDIAKAEGSDILRLESGWGSIAPTRPANPADPADPAYEWAGLDDAVKATVFRGMTPLVSLTGAPLWAEGPGRPADVVPGTWKPDATAFRPFAQALARRYDGTYPDPAVPGASLPRVTAFQPWNEPNLNTYLAPQWVKRGTGFAEASPGIYRALQNAFAAGIHASQPSALAVTAGTGPFGDPQPGGDRIMPARFWRGVMCLTAKLKRIAGCGPVSFSVLAHHPYSVSGPTAKSLNGDDVSLPDMGKLTKILRAAERRKTAPGKHRLWVTEISWDSGPDDPDGLPERTQAEWLAQSFMVLWRQGVDTITWFQVRDQAGPDYAATVQSGIYRFNGQPKLSAQAFAFPVAVERKSKGSVRVWLRAPAAGPIAIQVKRGGVWVTGRTVIATRHGVREVTVARRGGTSVRAVQGSLTALAAPIK